jgi:hypothetical protein
VDTLGVALTTRQLKSLEKVKGDTEKSRKQSTAPTLAGGRGVENSKLQLHGKPGCPGEKHIASLSHRISPQVLNQEQGFDVAVTL